MPLDQKQGHLASLIISIIILIVIVMLIIVVCVNWYNTNYTNNNQPLIQNPQALAAAAMYKNNQGGNINRAVNAIKNNPQKAALGAYAYRN
jgi:flagellar basal body-associated protein FliL